MSGEQQSRILETLLDTGGEYDDARKPRMKHPTGWEPGIDTEKGRICVRSRERPTEVAIDWSDWLDHFGFSGETFTVLDDTVEVRSWDANMGNGLVETFYYYKAKIVRKRESSEDISELVKEVKSHRKLKKLPAKGEWAYVVSLTDLQIGKRDGDGLAGVLARTLQAYDDVIYDVGVARKAGYNIGKIVIAGLGDIVEGCDGFYEMQTFSVELDRREQVKVARRLLIKLIQGWSTLAAEVLVICVPGNHGEHRRDGKAFTSFGDNDDVAVFEMVAEVLSENPERYGHVRFMIPENNLSMTVDLYGTILGVIHGHQAKGANANGLAHTKIWTWWKNQAHANTAVGDADILLSGHFHYYSAIQNGARTHFQAPALDSSSEWYENTMGYSTNSGVLTFLVGEDGWKRQTIL